ncbi:MAG: acyltransferase domain-containing protein, partial [Flavobacteriales bacterium]|nr:acyltransferase domain-containing protein [Flavobacteriales bacterium]
MAKTIDLLRKNPIAIIGMSSMFADADNIERFWENILLGVDSIKEIPDSRWSIEDYYDPDPLVPDKTYCKVGGFIPDVDFDPMEFGLPPNILEVTDASQLLALMVAKDALIDAGYTPGSEKLTADIKEKTGVILGVGGGQKLITPLTGRLQYPIWRRALESTGLSEEKIEEAIEKMKTAYIPWNENSFPGMLGNVISGRVANRFDLCGINCVVDAACAASLSAIKMAVGELLEGRCDMMITGGVDTDNSPFMYMSFSKTPAFSQKGSIRPFDHESDGMLIGEGVGMIVCKRLDDAVRDGDRIYATINGLGSSSDGRFKSVYAPRPQGQALAMNRAYEEAGFEASTVGLIEAHGTGTVAGDLSEGKSMKMVFSDNNPELGHIALGSVKSQIGHTKAAAGVAGIIKASLALHHKVLPGTINVTRPKPDMEIETTPFYLNSETRPWFAKSSKTPRRAGVSAFGFGGVNVHVAMEEFSEEHTENYRVHSLNKMILVHAISAHDLDTELRNRVESLQGEGAVKAFDALAKYSQEETIPKINPRVGFVASDVADAVKKFEIAIKMLGEKKDEMSWEHPIEGIWFRASALNNKDKVVALFSGQGSQYVNMGNSLACAYPTIRTSFQKANELFESRKEAPLTDRVYPVPVFNDEDRDQQDENLRQTQFAQPAIGALSVGMYKLFSHEGFSPDFYAGHSFGELTALWAAGAMDDDVYYKLAKSRGDAMALKGDGDTGSMLAVQGKLEDIQAKIAAYADVQVANINSGKQIILGGATDSLKALKDKLEHEGLAPKMLRVSAAFHTPFVAHAHQPFADAIAKAKFQGVSKPVYSNTTGKKYNIRAPKIKETLSKHMLSPVLFKEQVENMYADGARVFIEFGPRNILTNLVRDILGDQQHITVALNANPKKDSDKQLCEAAVQMAVMGMEVQGFDRFSDPYHEKAEKGKMSVSISGYNYISEGTRKKYDDLIHETTETVHVLEKSTEPQAPVSEAPPVESTAPTSGEAPEMKVINDNEESEMTKTELDILRKLQENLERLTDKQSKIEDILVRITSGAMIEQGTPRVAEPEAAKLEAAPVATPEPVVPPTPTPTPPPAPVASEPAPTSTGSVDRSSIESSLLAVIAEKTGYPSEMLELTMDMEADLGIDSIKRVEIFG